MSHELARLVAAREAAIARGDKALGRELYHQLQAMGAKPEDIDAGRIEQSQPETAQAPAAPERAVKPKAKRSTKE